MITTLISFIVVLGILIFIHELGHFAVAKFSGVGVEKFSLGFGPKLIAVTRGETEYRISILPLGGYVKMVGEAPGEEITEEERKKSFTHKPVSSRAAIVVAGPVMNLVLAVILLPIIFMVGIRVPDFLDKPAAVGYVIPDEAASRAGIATGDTIVSADTKKIDNWEGLLAILAMSPDREIEVEYLRDDALESTTLTPDASKMDGAGYGGMLPPMRPLIGAVASGYPAKAAGLAPGDLILSIDGRKIRHWVELEDIIHKDGSEKTFVVERDGEELTFKIEPKLKPDIDVFIVGISRQEETVLRKYGFVKAVKKGTWSAVDMTGRLFLVIKGLVVGQYSLKTLGGPILIAQVAGRAAESGVTDFLFLVAFLSLQLGIINLFPIPVLDGGHLVFFGIEAAKGSPLSEKFMGVTQQIGIALLIALMVLVTYNDIIRIVTSW